MIYGFDNEIYFDGSTCFIPSEFDVNDLPLSGPYSIEVEIKPTQAALNNNGGIIGYGIL